MIFASLKSAAIVALPPAPGWPNQDAYNTVFGQTPRIVAASVAAFFCGEFANSYVLAKLKLKTKGKLLWVRTIGSTVVGEAVDSAIFYPAAFAGVWETSLIGKVMVTNYLIKTCWEALLTPVTYRIVIFLKRAENEDYFDRDTRFTPFSLET
jgi:uncharacterized integral membrane protein (TIGR00697 family)